MEASNFNSEVEYQSISTANKINPEKTSPEKIAKDLAWNNVGFRIHGKAILQDCWGKVSSGQICAILGPSGAGKSSLLNVLAGRSSSNRSNGILIDGQITIGEKKINPIEYRRNIAYVMQDDSLLPTATPREALTFSAILRLSKEYQPSEITNRVNHLLSNLGLDDCADVIIGGALLKGISGGQRKRTSVGVELITDPTLLFLDEPTSGLDSFSAYNLIKLLKKHALINCAILCTIHQPSSEVFFQFDSAIFLVEGKVFYNHDIQHINTYFDIKGYTCPLNYNPSDFVMNLSQQYSYEELCSKDLIMKRPNDCSSSLESNSLEVIENDNKQIIFQFESSLLQQIIQITYREMVNTYRDTPALISRFGVTFVLNLIFGLIFYNIGSKSIDNTDDFNSHVGAISMVMIFALFGSGQSVMLTFPFERPMILREYVTGTYDLTAYFLSKLCMEVCLTFIQTCFQFILVYYLMNLQGRFILLVLICFFLGMVSNSLCVLLGCILPDVKDVTELSPLVFVPQILFAGFFVRTSQIPLFLRWAQYLCGMKYAMNLVLMTEFQVTNSWCQQSEQATHNCQSLLTNNNIHPSIYYIYIILMFVLFVVMRVLALLVLFYKAKRFY